MKRRKYSGLVRQQGGSAPQLFHRNTRASGKIASTQFLARPPGRSVTQQLQLEMPSPRRGCAAVLGRRLFSHLVSDEPSALNELGHLVGCVAGKQEPVSRLHLVGKSHEGQRVATEGKRHAPADDLRRLLHVVDGSNGKAPVGYWTPEMRAIL